MKPTDDPPDGSPSNSPANPSNDPMTPMTPIDRDIADAFAALDRTVPDRPPDDLTARVMARIGEVDGVGAPRPAASEQPPRPRGEDSGLHDIVALASRAKRRLSERDQSESDASDAVMLAAAPGGLRAVALPDPRAARQTAAPREPTRTDSRSSLPFWALGSVATLAAAAAVAVFVFGIGRGSDRSAEPAASSAAESGPTGALARVDQAPAGDASGRFAQAPPPPPGAPAPDGAADPLATAAPAGAGEPEPVERRKSVAAERERRERREDRAASDRPEREGKIEGGAARRSKESTAEEGAVGGVQGGEAPASGAAGGPPGDAPGGGTESGAKAGGEADLGDMLDAVTDEDPPKATPAPEAKVEEPPKEDKQELDRRAVSTALEAIRDAVKRCHQVEKFAGTVTVRFQVAPTGQVSKAAATGAHARSKTGACVAQAVLQARFPTFDGTPISISYPFLLSR